MMSVTRLYRWQWMCLSFGLLSLLAGFFSPDGSAAEGILSNDEQAHVISVVAEMSWAGVALGGGTRKMRLARPGPGKSGGARVVFLFAGKDVPVFLLDRLRQEREGESRYPGTNSVRHGGRCPFLTFSRCSGRADER